MTMTYDDILKQYARGKSNTGLIHTASASAASTANANSGFMALNIAVMQLGTTYPNTLIGFPECKKPSADMILIQDMVRGNGTGSSSSIVRLYRAGTVNLASSGNQFTPDAATFPLLRKEYGQASQPVSFIPVIQVTTATSGTAPVIQLRTSGGGTGYTDQDGNAVVGDVNFTFPLAATVVNSWYRLKLNTGDFAARAINQVNVVTPAATGAATIWLMELFNPAQSVVPAPAVFDSIFGSAFMPENINPAAATSGSVTSIKAGIAHSSNSAGVFGFEVAVESL